jgi:hypothetical protein
VPIVLNVTPRQIRGARSVHGTNAFFQPLITRAAREANRRMTDCGSERAANRHTAISLTPVLKSRPALIAPRWTRYERTIREFAIP